MSTAIVQQMQHETQASPAPMRYPAPEHTGHAEHAAQLARAAAEIARIGHGVRYYDAGGNGIGKPFEALKPIELAEAMTLANRFVASCQQGRIDRAKAAGRVIYTELLADAIEYHRKKHETSSNAVIIGDLLNTLRRELTSMAAVEGLFAGYHASLTLPRVSELPHAIVIEGRTWEIGQQANVWYWPGELTPMCQCGEWLTDDCLQGSPVVVTSEDGLAPAVQCANCANQFEIGPAIRIEARR